MRFVCLFVLSMLFSSCVRKNAKVWFFKAKRFILADTASPPSDFLNFSQNCASYPIFYIGQKQDTIRIGRKCSQKIKFDFELGYSKIYSDRTLKIVVDTAVILNTSVEYFSWIQHKAIEDSSKNYSSFLLTVQNISDSVLYMGRTRSLFFMYREAKDRKGNWVAIEKKLGDVGLCLSNQPQIALKQTEMIVSKVKRYKGTFITDCRLVFGYDNNKVFSNIFRDSIDEWMFNATMSTETKPSSAKQ